MLTRTTSYFDSELFIPSSEDKLKVELYLWSSMVGSYTILFVAHNTIFYGLTQSDIQIKPS